MIKYLWMFMMTIGVASASIVVEECVPGDDDPPLLSDWQPPCGFDCCSNASFPGWTCNGTCVLIDESDEDKGCKCQGNCRPPTGGGGGGVDDWRPGQDVMPSAGDSVALTIPAASEWHGGVAGQNVGVWYTHTQFVPTEADWNANHIAAGTSPAPVGFQTPMTFRLFEDVPSEVGAYGLDPTDFDDETLLFHCDSRTGGTGAYTTTGDETRARVYLRDGSVWLTYEITDIPTSAASLTSVRCSAPNPDPVTAAINGNVGVVVNWSN